MRTFILTHIYIWGLGDAGLRSICSLAVCFWLKKNVLVLQ